MTHLFFHHFFQCGQCCHLSFFQCHILSIVFLYRKADVFQSSSSPLNPQFGPICYKALSVCSYRIQSVHCVPHLTGALAVWPMTQALIATLNMTTLTQYQSMSLTLLPQQLALCSLTYVPTALWLAHWQTRSIVNLEAVRSTFVCSKCLHISAAEWSTWLVFVASQWAKSIPIYVKARCKMDCHTRHHAGNVLQQHDYLQCALCAFTATTYCLCLICHKGSWRVSMESA